VAGGDLDRETWVTSPLTARILGLPPVLVLVPSPSLAVRTHDLSPY